MKKIITNLAILIPLLMTACKEAEKKAPVKPEYDFRDLQYQDFYSRFKRQREEDCKTDCLASYFDAEDIEKTLNIKNVPNNAVGFVSIRKIPSKKNIIRQKNHFQTKQNIVTFFHEKRIQQKYKKHGMTHCKPSDEISSLVCFDDTFFKDEIYVYLPKENKINHVNNSIYFRCQSSYEKDMQKRNCELSVYLDPPYNINLRITFTDPNNFFYVVPYAEKLIFNSTGEHVWQTSTQVKAVNP